ncbi:unnamed protein product, partial [Hapterophycus canaliculatus]
MSYLLGAPYGAVFELDGNQLVRVDGELVEAEEEPPGEDVDSVNSGVRGTGDFLQVPASVSATDTRLQDNRGFTDTNTAQKLSEGDILQMKNDGKGGRAII